MHGAVETAMVGAPEARGRRPWMAGRLRDALIDLFRASGVAVTFGLLALVLFMVPGAEPQGVIRELQTLFFGPLAWITAAFSILWALVMFLKILDAYRKIAGFPWLASLSFAAAAASAVMALHALLP